MSAKPAQEPYHQAGTDEPVRERGRVLYWWPSFASPDASEAVGRRMVMVAVGWLVVLIVVVIVAVLVFG